MAAKISEPKASPAPLESTPYLEQDLASLSDAIDFFVRNRIFLAVGGLVGALIALIPTQVSQPYESDIAFETSTDDPFATQDSTRVTNALTDAFGQSDLDRIFANKFVATLDSLSNNSDSPLQNSAKIALRAWGEIFKTSQDREKASQVLEMRFSQYLREQMLALMKGASGSSDFRYFLKVTGPYNIRLIVSLPQPGATGAVSAATVVGLNEMIATYNRRIEETASKKVSTRAATAKARYEKTWDEQRRQIEASKLERNKIKVALFRISQEIARYERSLPKSIQKEDATLPLRRANRPILVEFSASEVAEGVESLENSAEISDLARRLAYLADNEVIDSDKLNNLLERIALVESERLRARSSNASANRSLSAAEEAMTATFRESANSMTAADITTLPKIKGGDAAAAMMQMSADIDRRRTTKPGVAAVYGGAAGLCLAIALCLAFHFFSHRHILFQSTNRAPRYDAPGDRH